MRAGSSFERSVQDRRKVVAAGGDAAGQKIHVEPRIARESRGIRPERASVVGDRHGRASHSGRARTDERRLRQSGG